LLQHLAEERAHGGDARPRPEQRRLGLRVREHGLADRVPLGLVAVE